MKETKKDKIKRSWMIGMLLLLFLNIGATGYFLYSLTLLGDIEKTLRIIVGIVLILLMVFFFFHLRKTARKKKKVRFTIDIILSIIYSAILIFIGGNIIKTIGKVGHVTARETTYSASIVTLSTNKATSINDISSSKPIGMIKDKKSVDGYQIPKQIIEDKGLKNKIESYDNYTDLLADLYDEKIEYIFLPSGYQTMFTSIEAYKNINIDPLWGKANVFNTASFARALKLVLQGRNLHDNLARHAYDELLMAKTKIRGFVYNGGSDGKCALVRDFNSLMPVAYSEDGGMTWKSDDSNEERFNRINQAVHPWYQYRGEYEDIGLRDKPSGNFSLVKGKQGYNWKDIWFHRNILPIDADSATNFDPFSGKAEFSLGEYQFAIISDNDMNCRLMFKDDDGWEDIPYDDFIQAVQMMQEQNIIDKTKQINNNCLLNPAIKRNK